MAKLKQVYICQECGYESGKWMGKCPSCNEWGSLVEEVVEAKKPSLTALRQYLQERILQEIPLVFSYTPKEAR